MLFSIVRKYLSEMSPIYTVDCRGPSASIQKKVGGLWPEIRLGENLITVGTDERKPLEQPFGCLISGVSFSVFQLFSYMEMGC